MPNDPLKIAIKGTTQEHLPIEDIIDDVVILKDGSAVSVLRVSSVNFDLLSEKEQSALVMAYGGILNSLNFPIQIIIKSETKDITSYLKRLDESENKQTNSLLKNRIIKYRKFVEELIKRNDVLSKSFYVVVKFSSSELGIKSAGKQSLIGLVKKDKDIGLPYPKEYILEKAKASLEPKKDHLIRLFSRLGLEIQPLDNKELIEIFYKIYNSQVFDNQKLNNVNYYSPMVTSK
jgi:type IV secretory pathway VirB4 component